MSSSHINDSSKQFVVTNHSYTSLAKLRDKTEVNIIGIVVSHRDISKPKDYIASFIITDPSFNIDGLNVHDTKRVDGVRVNLFSQDRNDLPIIRNPGDIILLRRMQVQYYNNRPQCVGICASLSTPAPYIWVLFPFNERKCIVSPPARKLTQRIKALQTAKNHGTISEGDRAELNMLEKFSPEIDKQALRYIKRLQEWWMNGGTEDPPQIINSLPEKRSNENYSVDYNRENKKSYSIDNNHHSFSSTSTTSSRKISSRPQIKLGDLKQSVFCDFNAQILAMKTDKSGSIVDLTITDYTPNPRFRFIELSINRELNHEEMLNSNVPNFPAGRRCFDLTLWDANAQSAIQKLNIGDYVRFENVVAKPHRLNQDGLLYGRIHGDSTNPNKVFFKKLSLNDSYSRQLAHARHVHVAMEEKVIKMLRKNMPPPSDVDDDILENIPRFHNQHEHLASDIPLIPSVDKGRLQISCKNNGLENENLFTQFIQESQTQTPKGLLRQNFTSLSPIEHKENKKPLQIESSRLAMMTYYPRQPKTRISDILRNETIPNKYRVEARIIDYIPRSIENFCKPFCLECRATFESSLKRCPTCKNNIIQWVWQFGFILEGKDSNHLTGIVTDEDGNIFFKGIEPCDLNENQDTLNNIRSRLSRVWGNLEDILNANLDPTCQDRKYGGYYSWCLKSYIIDDGTVLYRIFGTETRS